MLVIRRLRGGTGDKFSHSPEAADGRAEPAARAKPRCEFLLEVERTGIRLVQAQRLDTIEAVTEPCEASHNDTPVPAETKD